MNKLNPPGLCLYVRAKCSQGKIAVNRFLLLDIVNQTDYHYILIDVSDWCRICEVTFWPQSFDDVDVLQHIPIFIGAVTLNSGYIVFYGESDGAVDRLVCYTGCNTEVIVVLQQWPADCGQRKPLTDT